MAYLPTFIFWGQSNMRGGGILADLFAARPTQYPALFQGKYSNWLWWYQDFTSSSITGGLVELDFQTIRNGLDSGTGTVAGLTLTDTTKVWPTNLLVGVEITYNSQTGTVVSNTLNTATVGGWSGAVGAGPLPYTMTKAVPTVAHPIVDSQPQSLPYAALFGPALPATWRILTTLNGPILVINMGINGAYISRTDTNPVGTAVSWFDQGAHKSFAVTTTKLTGNGLTSQQSLMRILMEDVVPACNVSAITAGYEGIDIQGLFSLIGENEAQEEYRAELAGQSMANILTYMESQIDAGGYSQTEGAKIPKVVGGISTVSVFPYASVVMDQYEQLAATSRYIATFSTSDLTLTDGMHYNTTGILTIGDRLVDAWQEILEQADSALEPADQRPTLGSIRTKVLRRYERNTVSTDTQDPLVDQLINDSLREFYQVMGDAAWFLRRIEAMDLDIDPLTPVEMPATIMRVLRIESVAYPGLQIRWQEVGYTQQGRLQLLVAGFTNGPYNVHHLYRPRDLVGDSDAVPIPAQYEEAIVLLTLRRLAETSNNDVQIANYAAQAQSVVAMCKNDAKRTERQRMPTIDALGPFTALGLDGNYGETNIYGSLR